jgi:uncharacterized protein (TIGR02594 family)
MKHFASRGALVALALLCSSCASSPQAGALSARAASHIGETAPQLGLPRSLWCADFMNMLLGRQGASRAALSYARYGAPAAPGCTDCIAVIAPPRRGLHWHVGVVTSYDANGNPVIISGNQGRAVGEGIYPRARVRYWRAP